MQNCRLKSRRVQSSIAVEADMPSRSRTMRRNRLPEVQPDINTGTNENVLDCGLKERPAPDLRPYPARWLVSQVAFRPRSVNTHSFGQVHRQDLFVDGCQDDSNLGRVFKRVESGQRACKPIAAHGSREFSSRTDNSPVAHVRWWYNVCCGPLYSDLNWCTKNCVVSSYVFEPL